MNLRKVFTPLVIALTGMLAITGVASPVSAHASIQLYGSNATPNGYGVMFIRIPHGCTGGLATDTIEVSIPAGFGSVRPQQISGWVATTIKTGTVVTGVKWTAGSLPNSQFADFGISVKYPSAAGKYGLKVVQYCGTATAVWDGADLPMVNVAPAPSTLPGEMTVENHADKSLVIVADLSSTKGGSNAVLRVTVDGKIVKRFAAKLDSRGDFSGEFALKGRTSGGATYSILDGAVIDLLVNKVVLASATLGETSTVASSH